MRDHTGFVVPSVEAGPSIRPRRQTIPVVISFPTSVNTPLSPPPITMRLAIATIAIRANSRAYSARS